MSSSRARQPRRAAIGSASRALLGFGFYSGIEALASVIVGWRFTGTRLVSAVRTTRSEAGRRSVFLLAPYIAVEAAQALAAGTRAETSIVGIIVTAGSALLEPPLAVSPSEGWGRDSDRSRRCHPGCGGMAGRAG